jgi:hypothetical protein
MKKAMVVFALAALVFTFTMGAMAADQKECPKDAKAACCAKDAKCCAKDAKASCCPKDCGKGCPKDCAGVTLKGKVETKTEDNQQVAYVTISEAKTADGKAGCCKAGKSIKITGDKAADVAKLNGKEVTLKGTCKKCAEFVPTEVSS